MLRKNLNWQYQYRSDWGQAGIGHELRTVTSWIATKNSLIALAIGAAVIIPFAIYQIPEPKVVIEVPKPSEYQFADEWNAAASNVAMKSASLRVADPKPVQVETIKVEPNVVVAKEEIAPPQPKREKRDVCQRHGMHKVYRGKGWRCRR